MTQNRPAWSVSLDGQDLTDRIAPRLLSLSVTEKRSERADQLDLTLHDHDGALEIPKTGAKLTVKMGWKEGSDVRAGLVDKGVFTVDEVEHSGPPDIVTVRGRSADVAHDYRVRRDKAHIGKTVGDVVKKVAAANGLTAHVAPELAAIQLPPTAQSAKSDMAFVRDLGRRYDAVATVKGRKLVFAPVGSGKTASGKALPRLTVNRSDGDQHRFARANRESGNGVEAQWHDPKAAKRKTVKAGGSDKGKPKRLKRVYASEGDAKAAADSADKRARRKAGTMEVNLALGRPDIGPETRVTLKGWKAEIDGTKWLVEEATHSFDPAGSGLTTTLKLETAI